MKNLKFIFVFTALVIAWGNAVAADSFLQLSLYDDGDFKVQLDDVAYVDAGNIFETPIQAGEHNLLVTIVSNNLQFQGKIRIPAGFNVYAVIDEYNAFTIYKKVPVEKGRCNSECSYYRFIGGKNSSEVHDQHDKDKNIDPECRNVVMSDKDFKEFKKSIGNMNFENTNVTITESMLDQNTVSTKQLAELLTFFTFESNKLDIAKYAYTHTCDKKNYYMLYNSFNFDSSVEELKNYISGK